MCVCVCLHVSVKTLNCCYGIKWSERVIFVSINLIDGLFIATHARGCTAYFISIHHCRITSTLRSTLTEQAGLLGFVSVEKSQYQFFGMCVFFSSSPTLTLYE